MVVRFAVLGVRRSGWEILRRRLRSRILLLSFLDAAPVLLLLPLRPAGDFFLLQGKFRIHLSLLLPIR